MSETKDFRYIRTNQLLVAAFTELLNSKKFEDITINNLCEKAMIRRATFYTHFIDKYDFFAYYVQQQSDTFSGTLDTLPEDCDPNTYFLHMCGELLSFLNSHRAMVVHVMNSNAYPILLSILSEQIRFDLKKILFKEIPEEETDPIQTELLAAFYAGGLIQIVLRWLSQKNDLSEKEFIHRIELLIKEHPITGTIQIHAKRV